MFSHLRFFSLPLAEQVPEPAIVCDSVTCVNETCNYNLSCTIRDGGENVTYNWTRPAGGAVVPNESILHISQGPRDAHLAVTCTAQNPVSHSSATVSPNDFCAGNSLDSKVLPSAHVGGAGIGSLPLDQSQAFDTKCNLAPCSPRSHLAADLTCQPARQGAVCTRVVCVTRAASQGQWGAAWAQGESCTG